MMTTQTVVPAPTDMVLLAQLDAILAEVQELRAVIQKRRSAAAAIDFVAQLSGALGPAPADEMEFFRDNDLDWERFKMKYLKIHTLTKGQWYDRDTILLHAAFQVLVDFMEQERPAEIVDWEHDELHRNVWSELSQLYRWWKEERPQRRDPLDDGTPPPEEEYRFLDDGQLIFPDRAKYPEYYAALDKSWALETEWFEEDQRQLHRLIEVRPYLWT